MDSISSPLSSASFLLVIAVVGSGVCRGGGSVSSLSMVNVDLLVVPEGLSGVLK